MSARHSLTHKLRVDVHAVSLAARDPSVPWHARAVGLLVAAYALSPIDLIPDFIPVLGLLDDLVLVPIGIWLFLRLLPDGVFERHRIDAERAAERPGSGWGALIVILIWALTAVAVWRMWSWLYL